MIATYRRARQLLAVVLVVGFVPRVLGVLGRPGRFVFDEVYYVGAARKYLHGSMLVNTEHPPLGKWLIAAGIGTLGDRPLGWRMPSLLAGLATLVLTWALARRLLRSELWATAATALVALDGLSILGSRTAILDSFLPPLIVGAVLLLVRARDVDGSPGWRPLLGAGALLGAACAVKWQAVPVLAVAPLAWWWSAPERRARVGELVRVAAAFVVVPVTVYVAAHLGHVVHLGVGRTAELPGEALRYHSEFRALHPTASRAWTWLWLRRPSFWAYERRGDRVTMLSDLGNPGLWWAFVLCLPSIVVRWWRSDDRGVAVVTAALATMYLPWLVVLRPGFSFYLLPMVPFMAIGVVASLHALIRVRPRLGRGAAGVVAVAVLVSVVAFWPRWTNTETSMRSCARTAILPGWACE